MLCINCIKEGNLSTYRIAFREVITSFGIKVKIRPNKDTGDPEMVISSTIATPGGDLPSTEVHEVISLIDLAKKEIEKEKEREKIESEE